MEPKKALKRFYTLVVILSVAKDLQVIYGRNVDMSLPGDSSQAQNDKTLVFNSNDR